MFIAKRTTLGKVLRQVIYNYLISEELNREGSSSIKETRSFVIDLTINVENHYIYSAITYKVRLLVLGYYKSIRE